MKIERQSPWLDFGAALIVPPDHTPWTLDYHFDVAFRPKREWFPHKRTCHGVYLREDAPFNLRKMRGVYLIAFRGRVLYVGRAAGKETVLSRLGKHRLKLTGSDKGKGYYHSQRWVEFTVARYRADPILIRTDDLAEFSFSFIEVREPDHGGMKALEGGVYRACIEQGQTPILNDPRGIAKLGSGKVFLP